MPQTIEQILGGPNLTGVIQATTTGIPDVFPASFYADRKPVDGDTGEYTQVKGTRQTARIAAYGSPSQHRALKDVAKLPVKLIHTVESITHKPHVLTNLLNYNELSKQHLGIAEVTRQSREFRQLFDNLRVGALTSALFLGHIYFDGNGNLLPTSSGAKVDVNFQIPANNLTQLNGIIATSWDSTTANLLTQLSNLKKAARKLTGYPLKHAFYGANVQDYILANTKYQTLIGRNPQFNAANLGGEIGPFGGFDWHPAYEAFFEDQNSVNQSLVGDDQVMFCPEPSLDWLEWLEGTYPVPTTVGAITPDMVGAIGTVNVATGMFSYGQVVSDPVTVKQVAGDTFLPVLKVPSAVFVATVKFT